MTEELEGHLRDEFARLVTGGVPQADGELSTQEDRLIRALAKAAGITDAHLAGIVATAPRMITATPPALPS